MNILEAYSRGLSARETAKMFGCDAKTVRRRAHEAGIIRTKSEGMYLRYNPTTAHKDELVLTLPKSGVTIRSPYIVMPWYPGTR